MDRPRVLEKGSFLSTISASWKDQNDEISANPTMLYFTTHAEALVSLFNSHWRERIFGLTVGGEFNSDTEVIEIHTYYVTQAVVTALPTEELNTIVNIGRPDMQATHCGKTEGEVYSADYHIRHSVMVDGNAVTLTGRLPCYFICNDFATGSGVLVHVESYEVLAAEIFAFVNEIIAERGLPTENIRPITISNVLLEFNHELKLHPERYLRSVFIEPVADLENAMASSLSPISSPVLSPRNIALPSSPKPSPSEPIGTIDQFSRVPDDILRIIGLNMSPDDIYRACATSRRFRALFCGPQTSEIFWLQKVRKDFPQTDPRAKLEDQSWRGFYLQVAAAILGPPVQIQPPVRRQLFAADEIRDMGQADLADNGAVIRRARAGDEADRIFFPPPARPMGIGNAFPDMIRARARGVPDAVMQMHGRMRDPAEAEEQARNEAAMQEGLQHFNRVGIRDRRFDQLPVGFNADFDGDKVHIDEPHIDVVAVGRRNLRRDLRRRLVANPNEEFNEELEQELVDQYEERYPDLLRDDIIRIVREVLGPQHEIGDDEHEANNAAWMENDMEEERRRFLEDRENTRREFRQELERRYDPLMGYDEDVENDLVARYQNQWPDLERQDMLEILRDYFQPDDAGSEEEDLGQEAIQQWEREGVNINPLVFQMQPGPGPDDLFGFDGDAVVDDLGQRRDARRAVEEYRDANRGQEYTKELEEELVRRIGYLYPDVQRDDAVRIIRDVLDVPDEIGGGQIDNNEIDEEDLIVLEKLTREHRRENMIREFRQELHEQYDPAMKYDRGEEEALLGRYRNAWPGLDEDDVKKILRDYFQAGDIESSGDEDMRQYDRDSGNEDDGSDQDMEGANIREARPGIAQAEIQSLIREANSRRFEFFRDAYLPENERNAVQVDRLVRILNAAIPEPDIGRYNIDFENALVNTLEWDFNLPRGEIARTVRHHYLG